MRHREDGRHLPFASYLVCYLAKTKGLDAVVRGGNGADDGGIFIECGGFGHYWCELNFEEVQYYIDITSEQFGFHPYIVKLANDITGWPRYILVIRKRSIVI